MISRGVFAEGEGSVCVLGVVWERFGLNNMLVEYTYFADCYRRCSEIVF